MYIDKFGLKVLKEAYILENLSSEEKQKEITWKKVYGKSLSELEKAWLSCLKKT